MNEIKPITGSRSWEEYVSLGLAAREKGDEKRWELGDLACEIEAKYGEGAIEAWGREIGLRRSTAYEYKKVSAFFPDPERSNFVTANPMVTYSHFRMATKLGDLNYAWPFLADCSSDGWTVEQAERMLAGEPGQKGFVMRTIYKGKAEVRYDDFTEEFYIAGSTPELAKFLLESDPSTEIEITVKVKEMVEVKVR